jgi:hypothetical protein
MKRIKKGLRMVFLAMAYVMVSAVFGQAAAPDAASGMIPDPSSCTVPFLLDHNRMLVEAEVQREDGSWRKARLWVDSGSPVFSMSEPLARDLGIELPSADSLTTGISTLDVPPPSEIRIGGKRLHFDGVKSKVLFKPFWLFGSTHADANLPSTVLQKYQVVFDYPNAWLTLAEPGTLKPSGVPSPAIVNPETGIFQIDAVIDGDTLGFALDNGASFSFMSEETLLKLSDSHPEWPRMIGTLGCANMWGWWPPHERLFPVVRVPELVCGGLLIRNTGMAGVPRFGLDGPTLGEWYSQKTARPVVGFLGANALKSFRIEVDYANGLVYFEKTSESSVTDMDLVGLSVRQLDDGSYEIIGVARKDGRSAVEGVEVGDVLISIGDLTVKSATMGTVVDALRGKPGENRVLMLERKGRPFRIEARVEHFL